jgi:excisionase family DNA binding protein
MDAKPWRIRVEKDGTRLVNVDAFLHRLVDVLLDLDRADTSTIPAADQPDRLLTAEDAAKRLGVSRRYIYIHADTYPFTRRLGPRTLRFSERGMERWLARGVRQ